TPPVSPTAAEPTAPAATVEDSTPTVGAPGNAASGPITLEAPVPAVAPPQRPRPTAGAGVLDTGPAPVRDERDAGLGDNQRHVALVASVRTVFVLGSGFEPYAERAVLPSFGLGASAAVAVDGPFVFALGGDWEVAGSNSNVRGAETTLVLHRFTVVPQARYHFSRRIAGFGRVGIGAGYLRGQLEDQAVGVERSDDAMVVSADAGAGVTVQLTSTRHSERKAIRFWLSAEGGYAWNDDAELAFESDDAPQRSAAISFGELSLQGPFARLSAALTF
ncbi:MAG TPA: hypothetical protein VIM73_02150, partial [Polyangiaceae bacterium]